MARSWHARGRAYARPRPVVLLSIVGAAALLAVAVLVCADAERSPAVSPDAVVPRSADIVIATLPRGYEALRPDGSLGAAAARPAANVEQLLRLAARTGDGRFASRASAALERLPEAERDSVRVLKLRAHALQHSHRFEEAARVLDQAVLADPRDGAARLARAQILLVLGKVRHARADCRALVAGVDIALGSMCASAVALRAGEYAQAAQLLDTLLPVDADRPPDPMRFAALMRAEIASRAGDVVDADDRFARVLAWFPDDVRVRIAAARHYRRNGRPEEALASLGEANESDGVRVQRVLAAVEAGHTGALLQARGMAREFARARREGLEVELRDHAELLLALGTHAEAALGLSLENFRTQRDFEDVAILQRAALAARRPQALDEVDAWAASEGVSTTGDGR